MGELSYMYAPTIVRNQANANGRCGHNMIPKWCAFCNPVPLGSGKKRTKRKTTKAEPTVIIVLVDATDNEVLGTFYDKQEAVDAKKEMCDMMDDPGCCYLDVRIKGEVDDAK